MRFFTYLTRGQAAPAVLAGSRGLDLGAAAQRYCSAHPDERGAAPGGSLSLLDWMADEERQTLAQNVTRWTLDADARGESWPGRDGELFELDSVTFLAPVPAPGKVICIAGNYPAPGSLEKPPFPTIFLKPTGGVTGHQAPVVIPALAQNVAYEVELALIIGKRGRHLKHAEALSCVAGYTIGNDLGDRVLEKRSSQWTSGKMFDTFTPMGPFAVTKDEIPDPGKLEMTTTLNGQRVQHGSTGQMFFGPAELVSLLSELTTLQPGDVVLCGSPKMMGEQPNPALAVKPGDRIEVSIEQLGTLSNPAVAEGQAEA